MVTSFEEKLTAQQTAALRERIDAIATLLADAAAASAADCLVYLGNDFFTAAKQVDAQRAARLREPWIALMNRRMADPQASEADRVMALVSRLEAVRAFSSDGKIPADDVESAQQRVDVALANTADDDARSAVVNSVLWLYETLEEKERAYALLEHEVATSKSLYYYLSDLASLEEERGHTDEALELLERGHRESRGAATRFQCGYGFAAGVAVTRPNPETWMMASPSCAPS